MLRCWAEARIAYPVISSCRQLLLLFLFPAFSYAQGTIQILVSGVPPVLSSPYIGELEQSYYQGRYHIQVIYNNPDPVPVRFEFEMALSRQGKEVFRVRSRPVAFTPGNYFYRTFDDTPAIRFTENPLDYVLFGTGDNVRDVVWYYNGTEVYAVRKGDS